MPLDSCGSADVFGRAAGAPSDVTAAQIVVGMAVARKPAGEFAVRIGTADRVDLGDVVGVLGEFDDQNPNGTDRRKLEID